MANDLNIVYKIAADISGLQTGVDRAAKSAESLETTASRLGTALTGLFTITAVTGFAESILGAADAFKKMAQQAGISTDEAQKFNYIAGQTSVSVESLIGAAQNLQQRLGDDNSGAAGAMRKLGIEADTFNKLGTYQQMTTLSSAIQGIQDPTEQASVAAALFGKTWKEILPAIKSGMKDVGDQAPIMAASTIESLDRIDDALKRAKQQATAWGGNLVLAFEAAGFALGDFLSQFNPEHFGATTSEVLKFEKELNDPSGLKGALGAAQRAAAGLTQGAVALKSEGMEPLRKVLGPTRAEMIDLDLEIERNVAATKRAAQASKEAADKQKQWQDSVTNATIAMNLSTFTLNRYGAVTLPAVRSSLEGVDLEIHTLSTEELPSLHVNLNKVGQAGVAAFSDSKKHADLFALAIRELSDVFTQLAKIGPVWVGTLITDLGKLTTTWRTATQAVKEYGAASDEAKVASAAMATSWVTIALQVIVWLGKAQAKSDALNTALANLKYSAAATFADATRALGQYADSFIAAITNAKTLAEAQKAIADLTREIDFQNQAMKTLDETTKKYGFSLDQLGPALQQQQLNEKFNELFQDYKVLHAGGVDQVAITQRMSAAVSQYVQDAIRMGTSVPAAMRGMLQNFIDNHDLIDANGNAITDLASSGITFAENMTQSVQRVIDSIDKLVEAITRGLGLAIDNIPKKVNVDIDINQRTHLSTDGAAPGDVFPRDPWIDFPYKTNGDLVPVLAHDGGMIRGVGNIQHFATGGLVDTVPAMLRPGEMVLTPEQQRAWLGGGGVRVGAIYTTVVAAPGDDLQVLARKNAEALRISAEFYEAVATVSRRAVGA